MHLYIDVSWLLDVQEAALGTDDMSVADYSALVAAVARHKTKLPTLEAADPDAAWRAAALMHTIVRLEPLPHRNSLFAAFVAAQYMDQSGEGIDPPYGALSDLVRKIRDSRLRVPAVADQLRAWKL
ncbi:toxin Doc [Streptomyces justiciae]|uniref:Toxin Doc n=1 Tax=Streptomyces justiciae TaxID=2780140 RepID=A0ABU3M7M2_9ACTN|nr:toxin Doc [Streptomyces justiciae]MBE8478421.1 toxin Doc [Streptomyces justiciae]MCW8384165.1 toxin Doc [Streptomyces justiciae]MDT7847527.1 toxin Doc [Streptomyces justiciae]